MNNTPEGQLKACIELLDRVDARLQEAIKSSRPVLEVLLRGHVTATAQLAAEIRATSKAAEMEALLRKRD